MHEKRYKHLKCDTYSIRHGYDKKKCLVHARCCYTPERMVATAQYLNVEGSDLFSGILMSQSFDGGITWSEFETQSGLAPISDEKYVTVACDATPMYHKKTNTVLLLGHTTEYENGAMSPTGRKRQTFFSVFNKEKNEFGQMRRNDTTKPSPRAGKGD